VPLSGFRDSLLIKQVDGRRLERVPAVWALSYQNWTRTDEGAVDCQERQGERSALRSLAAAKPRLEGKHTARGKEVWEKSR